VAAVGQRKITYDARGLAEPFADVPKISEIDGTRARFDAQELTTRAINLELRWLLYEVGVKEVEVDNPGSKHSLGVGFLTRCRITFNGSLGYFGCGLIDGPEIHITGRVGWSACENMMAGVVVVDGNAGSLTGAALPGRDLGGQGLVRDVDVEERGLAARELQDVAVLLLHELAAAQGDVAGDGGEDPGVLQDQAIVAAQVEAGAERVV